MINKIKIVVEEFRQRQRKIISTSLENEWAHVYHDSIRGKEWLQNLSLNVGRWAGNYAFFYVLNRVLSSFKPNSIIEFGLGESSKFISAYLEHELEHSTHEIIEESESWKNHFLNNNSLSVRTKINTHQLCQKEIKGFKVNMYDNFKVNKKFDLYLIDGPFGSPRYSRYDIVRLAESFDTKDEFVILFDDYERKGEQDTVSDLLQLFKKKQIEIYKRTYVGNKRVLVLGTKKYKYIQSL